MSALLPCIQWLVRRVLAVREEWGDAGKRLSSYSFRRRYASQWQTVKKEEARREGAALFERRMRESAYRVKRRMKRKDDKGEGEAGKGGEEEVIQVLLEYGREPRLDRLKVGDGVEDEKNRKGKDRQPGEGGQEDAFEGMMASSDDVSLSGSAARKIVSLRQKELKEAAARYDEAAEESKATGGKAAHQRQMEIVQRQVLSQRESIEAARKILEEERKKMKNLSLARQGMEADSQAVEGKRQRILDALNKPGQESKVAQLIAIGDDIKKRAAADHERRAGYQKQLEDMQEKITSGEAGKLSEEEAEEIKNLKQSLRNETNRREAMRSGLARIGREVAFLKRKVEDIPTQPELVQYNRRFTELYEQVQSTLDENRSYYEAYNLLVEKQKYVTRETSLLNSVQAQYAEAMTSSAGRSAIVQSIQDTVNGMKNTLDKKRALVTVDEEMMAHMKVEHATKTEEQREYISLIQELQIQYAEAEVLGT